MIRAQKIKLRPEFIKLTPSERLFNCPLPLIGLTGGLASGKSTATQIFQKWGCPTLCADQLIKSLYTRPATLDFVRQNFPQAIGEAGISFPALRQLVFADGEKKRQLEGFLYPQLPEAFREHLRQLPNPTFVIYDVPLLFERDLGKKFDLTLCIYIGPQEQYQRLIRRDGISPELAQQMLKSQWPLDKKRELADFTLSNEGTVEDLEREIQELMSKIFTRID